MSGVQGKRVCLGFQQKPALPSGLLGIRTWPVASSSSKSSSLDVNSVCLKHVTLLVELQGGLWLSIQIVGHFLLEQ